MRISGYAGAIYFVRRSNSCCGADMYSRRLATVLSAVLIGAPSRGVEP